MRGPTEQYPTRDVTLDRLTPRRTNGRASMMPQVLDLTVNFTAVSSQRWRFSVTQRAMSGPFSRPRVTETQLVGAR
ncbi:MAG: hypothetical protein Q8Q09_17000 [Deltaproteobacteria bacterium]|nr:hypothetical protein [Deltaproteobacteria bacterium]